MKAHIRIPPLAALLAVLLLSSSSLATQPREQINVASLGPQVGERVPDFSLPDQFGQLQSLDSIRGPNGTMLLFHRSADW
ncbi:MAG: hypothetical protein VB977_14100 [Pseudohongiellaceae bacterium]|nr:hypothetical protein [Gammaproteobacteria bacterium]